MSEKISLLHPSFSQEVDIELLDKSLIVTAESYSPRVVSFSNEGIAVNIAVIPVHGSLEHRSNDHYPGCYTGYNFIASAYITAVNDSAIDGIVFDHHSGGGMVHGAFELADLIYSNREAKPVVSIIDATAYSAAYLIASQTNHIYISANGGAGSIGVRVIHANYKKMYEDMGIEMTELYSGKHKIRGSQLKSLSDDDKEAINEELDFSYEMFVTTVSRGRGLDASVFRDTDAACFIGVKAAEAGLVDTVMSPSDAYNDFALSLIKDTVGGIKMSEEKTKAMDASLENIDASALMADGASSERARISGILACDEAAGKDSLAKHLAFDTEMSVDGAKKILSHALCAAKPEQESGKSKSINSEMFSAAMSADNPNIGASTGAVEGDNQKSAASSILADFNLATGSKAGEL